MKHVKVAIQGITASFHEAAANKFFGDEIEVIECLTFNNLCETLKTGRAEFAVMAIENTLAGSLLSNYSLIQDYHFKIVGEVFLRIHMNLLAFPGVKKHEINFVHSHPIAIRQCAEFLWSLPNVKIIEKEDTALCAKEIAEQKMTDVAAIASESAAQKFKLNILEKGIETNKKNFTRFLVLNKQDIHSENNNKASLSFQLQHRSGSLADALMIFKENEINLTKIQSVPVMGKPYEYSFHIDLEWENYSNYTKALNYLIKIVSNLTVFGEYKKGDIQSLLNGE
jgi:prephenate dehydratase